MTVKELRELLDLLRDDDEIMALDDKLRLHPAGHMYQISEPVEVKPGFGPGEQPRRFYLTPRRGKE